MLLPGALNWSYQLDFLFSEIMVLSWFFKYGRFPAVRLTLISKLVGPVSNPLD
jgi:hypothetical protein